MTTTTARQIVRRIAQQAAAVGLATVMTLVALVSLNALATEQHAATQLARAAAAQQQAQAVQATAERG